MNIDTMTREEMLQETAANKNSRYSTEDLIDAGDYVYTDRNGYLYYSNGEEVLNEDELPEDGWFECTDVDLDDVDGYCDSGCYDNPLYDNDDEW